MPTATIDRQGLTSVVRPVLATPVSVRFRDQATGQWLHGLSEPKIDPNHFRVHLDVRAYAPCKYQGTRRHGAVRFFRQRGGKVIGWPVAVDDGSCCDVCGTPRELVAVREGPANLCTNVFAKWVQAGILGSTQTITDVGGTGRSVTKTVDGGTATITGCAGTGGTAATVADTNLQTQTETTTSVTVNAVSGTGSSGTFTVTYTVTATADRAYQEVGLKITTTTTAWVFLITHDTFTTLNVSNTGTLATTYTFTNS
jgi:hypothetical protein